MCVLQLRSMNKGSASTILMVVAAAIVGGLITFAVTQKEERQEEKSYLPPSVENAPQRQEEPQKTVTVHIPTPEDLQAIIETPYIPEPPHDETLSKESPKTFQEGVVQTTEGNKENAFDEVDIIWLARDGAWSANGTPPSCPEPFTIQTPVDMSRVTDALWPGQTRGGDYKGHGGFRFGNSTADDIEVYAPVGSHLVQASQYLESGDKQYLLFFSVPCGYFYRFDHVRVLSPKLADALKSLPPATEGDSRTTFITPPVYVEKGELIGTSVGILPANIFVDFGLYDVREPNNVTPNPTWTTLFERDVEFGQYGVCFFDYLPGEDGSIMRSLPTGKEGKTSDYCL